ncbi:MAG: transketolase, partial [Gammaproteobacteria bacterium]
PLLPEFFGGSADLTGSNLTNWSTCENFSAANPTGNYLSYGVREFGMAAMMNGMTLHGGILPFGGTFLTFSDYSRNAIRMAALMKQRIIHVFTHDSIGLGEDGPTHQPVEHTASLRLIPGVEVWRPADAVETMVAWQQAVEYQLGPTALILSRQTLAHQQRSDATIAQIKQGGYCLVDSDSPAQVVIIATGSEVQLAVTAQRLLADQGVAVRVVSMPNPKRFLKQPTSYRDEVLPPGIPRVAVEAGVTDSWYRLVGDQGQVIGLDRFGESAPAAELFELFGITPQAVIDAVKDCL